MSWYTGNAIFYFRLKSGIQTEFPVWENIYLVQADSFEQARRKIATRASEAAGDSAASLIYENQPAELVFMGIRKITSCENETCRPEDGNEVSYNEFVLGDLDSVRRLSEGFPTDLTYEANDFTNE